MKRAKRSTTVAVFVLAVVGHGLLIALLTLERPQFRFLPPALPERRTVEVTLTPLPRVPLPKPPPNRPRISPERAPPAAPPAPAPPISVPAAPRELPNLARPVFRVWPRPLPGGVDWGGTGCDDRNGRHLTDEQKEKCLKRWGSPSQVVAELPPMIAKQVKGEFDRRLHCQKAYDDAPVPIGAQPTAKATMGYIPSFKECPPGDR
jgi:hypothetical protein